jgi:hypothetical protein
MGNEGLRRPDSSRDKWDLLVRRRLAQSAWVMERFILMPRIMCPNAGLSSSELFSFSWFLRERVRVA